MKLAKRIKDVDGVDILVIGSFMMDLVVKSPRAPENGETIIGISFSKFPGGKGANQAVAASRLGANVTMVGKVGADPFGEEALETLKNERINIQYMLKDPDNSTGVGFVTVEANGNNRIIVVPGANLQYSKHDLVKIKDLIRKAKIIILQLEMDIDMIEQAVAYAYEYDVPVILNPAPARELSDQLLSKVTYLTPNETEAEILTGVKIFNNEDAIKAGKILLEKGVKNVVITLGEKGAIIVNSLGATHVSGYQVNAVDTVAAGDSFNGALAVGLIKGMELKEVVKFANAVGALTVTKHGAIPSLPTSKDVENFLKHLKVTGH